MTSKAWSTVGIASSGVYGSIGANTSIQTYDTRLERYLCKLAEGGTVFDKRQVPETDLIHWVVGGPMLKEDLPPGHKSSFGDSPIPCLDGRECKGFDYISLDLYVKLWIGLGTRVGTRKGDLIFWNDGSMTPIVEYLDPEYLGG